MGYPRLVRRRNNKLYWVAEDGFWAPLIAGGSKDPVPDPDDDDDEEDPDDDPDDPELGDGTKRFTQEDVNRFLARDRKRTRSSVVKELEGKLKMPIAEAIDTLDKLSQGLKPEAAAALDRRQRDLEDRQADLDKREINLTVRAKLQEAGIKPKRLAKASRLVDLDDDPDDEDIASAVEELKQDMPELFGSEKTNEDEDKTPPRRTPSSDPGRPPRMRRPPAEDGFAQGTEIAKKYLAQGSMNGF